MAIAFDQRLGEGTGTTTVTFAAAAAILAGTFVVLWIACDNTTGTNLPNVSSVTFNGVAQTFSTVAAHNSPSTTAGAATRGFIVVVPSSTALSASQNVVVSFSAAPAKCVAIVASFTGVTTTVVGAAGQASGTVASLASGIQSGAVANGVGYLGLCLASCENNVAYTGWSNSQSVPGGDGDVFTTGGGAAANVALLAGYVIGTGDGSTGALCQAAGGANDGGLAVVALGAATTPSLTPLRSASRGQPVLGLTARPKRRRAA